MQRLCRQSEVCVPGPSTQQVPGDVWLWSLLSLSLYIDKVTSHEQ